MGRVATSPHRRIRSRLAVDGSSTPTSYALATGGELTTDTPTSVVHTFTSGGSFTLSGIGILKATVTISGTGTFGALSSSGTAYADMDAVTVTVTSGSVTVTYDPTTEYVTDMKAWFDAAVSSTITHSSGTVSAWADRSGTGNNLAAAAGTTSTGVNTMNGLNVLSFANSRMSVVPSPTIGASAVSLYAVFKKTGANNANEAIPVLLSSSNLGYPVDGYSASRLINSSNISVTSGSIGNIQTYTSATQWSAIVKDSTRSWVERVNGTQTFTAGGGGTWNSGGTLCLGGRTDGVTFLRGDIASVIVFDVQHTTAKSQIVEGYQKAKWGTP